MIDFSISCHETIILSTWENLIERISFSAVGATTIANLDENLGSADVKLSPSEAEEEAAAVPMNEVAGDTSPISTIGRLQIPRRWNHGRLNLEPENLEI